MFGFATAARRTLRNRFGLWPLYEARNRLLFGHRVPALRRFENAEVQRLRPAMDGHDQAMVVDAAMVVAAMVVTVIPTYRRPELLRAAVCSALDQTVTDHLVVVVADGGGLGPLPAHPRLVTLSLSTNTGVAGLVRNVGIRLTRSTYLAFLDDDNTWRGDHLELALARLARGADVVYTAIERRNSDGQLLDVVSRPFNRRDFADGTPYVDTNALVVRRHPGVIFSRLPRRRNTLPGEDWEFVHRIAKRHLVEHEPEPTVRYLVHNASYYTDWRHDYPAAARE